ncbi:MAG TPA: L-threonylcarbamoyladenylate synthase [Verrucomicrobiae bacterium]|nr:L-threonylcarbamoyladenylate synthase [Verrucomicrobiae bacterium]
MDFENLARAAELLRQGEVVGLPTETVYGLAANALNPEAVARVYELKGRPAFNPIIVHVCSVEMARECVHEWPALAQKLADVFWPGPLTLVLPRSEEIPDIVTAGGTTVGIRWPRHPLMQEVIRLCGFPLAAPSANRSTEISPTNAEHVRKSFGNRIPLIVDGGQSQIGIESTVLDLSVSPSRILRPGMIHAESIVAVTGELAADGAGAERLKSPGLLPKHYSPKATLAIRQWQDATEMETQPEEVRIIAHSKIPKHGNVTIMPHDPEAYGRALYAELHRCDEAGVRLIIVEAVPDTAEWSAIRDRLSRAAS